jgi:hypothetical protein
MSNHFVNTVAEEAVWKFLQLQTFSWCDPTHIRRGLENRDAQGGGIADPQVPGQEDMPGEGEESSIKRVPLIIAACADSSPLLPYRGNWDVDLELSVINSAFDVTRDAHIQRTHEVFILFDTTTIANDLMEAHGEFFTAKVVHGQRGYRFSGNNFESYAQFKLISCCASKLT